MDGIADAIRAVGRVESPENPRNVADALCNIAESLERIANTLASIDETLASPLMGDALRNIAVME